MNMQLVVLDINECLEGNPCNGPITECTNTAGAYFCHCPGNHTQLVNYDSQDVFCIGKYFHHQVIMSQFSCITLCLSSSD